MMGVIGESRLGSRDRWPVVSIHSAHARFVSRMLTLQRLSPTLVPIVPLVLHVLLVNSVAFRRSQGDAVAPPVDLFL